MLIPRRVDQNACPMLCELRIVMKCIPWCARGPFFVKPAIVKLVVVSQVCGTPDSRRWPAHEELPSFGSMMPKNTYPDRLKQHLVSGDCARNVSGAACGSHEYWCCVSNSSIMTSFGKLPRKVLKCPSMIFISGSLSFLPCTFHRSASTKTLGIF